KFLPPFYLSSTVPGVQGNGVFLLCNFAFIPPTIYIMFLYILPGWAGNPLSGKNNRLIKKILDKP
ncbi:MAG: hypothetical protein IKY00_07695, partial [Clostridia bacterium]|nr:hypothetical protein [Clostridia bacterium]